MKPHLKRALELIFVPLAAAIVFIEDVLLHYLGVAMAAFGRWPPVARVEAWLASLPPWAALVAFVAPSTLVLPVKLAAVWFALQGKFVLAAAAIGIGKIVATALVARLYKVLRPTLLRLSWYLRAERPGCSRGATGSMPSCVRCRPGRGRRPCRTRLGSGWRNWFRGYAYASC